METELVISLVTFTGDEQFTNNVFMFTEMERRLRH